MDDCTPSVLIKVKKIQARDDFMQGIITVLKLLKAITLLDQTSRFMYS